MKMSTVTTPQSDKGYMNNTKIVNCLPICGAISSNTSYQIESLPKKGICVTISFAFNVSLIGSGVKITAFDIAVMDSVYTLQLAGADCFTPEMVARVMSGKMDKDVTPETAACISQSLNKLSLIKISIDCTKEFQQRKLLAKGQQARYSTYLLPLECIQVISANHKAVMDGYHLIQKPAIFEYAEQIHQIISFPLTVLQSGKLSDTPEALLLKRALLRRIECMKNNRNRYQTRDICYERYDTGLHREKGLFAEIGLTKENFQTDSGSWWRKKRSSLHKKVLAILDGFQDVNYIKGYSITRDSNSRITSIHIQLYEDSS